MAPSSKLGRGKPLKNQTKEVLQKIYRYFESEIERDPNSTVTAGQLVAHATGVSIYALRRLINEKPNVAVKSEPGTTRRRCKKNIVSNDYGAQAMRRIIHSFYTKDEEFPIMKDLYLILKGDLDYQGSLCTLRRHVTKLGFKWIEKADNNSILIEKHDVRYARIQYLTKIEGYRAQGRNIVYTGEMVIESSRTASKPKPDGSSTLLRQPAKKKVVILLAGDQNGVLKNTLFMFDGNKKDMKEETEYKREYFEQYEKWYKIFVLPNLKPSSIVVVDGASPFNNRVSNPTPHSNSRKREMMDYLTARNVPYSVDMYKSQLYQLVLMNKDKYGDYKTDAYLREHGHTVLRLPPHHPDLNPIKTILTSVSSYVGKDINFAIDSVMKIAKEKIYSLELEDWVVGFRTAEAEENNLKAIDKIIDEISEKTFMIYDDEDDDSDYEDNGSDQDSMDMDSD
ncbi:putative dde superfamily endonuclease [Operophtera brumata]|uniref:Putative dde superfamily endonuclease n=1 Tax=Operophtera brumata TaxID=104452 RepID=A0A0L7LQY3_OPEBR|nr:putative dde superfamily endonuclease [Operophtera brumata]